MSKRKPKTAMRRFVLRRNEDVSGTSGTGIVAEGCLFSNGFCALTWLTSLSSLSWYHSPDVLISVHGHDGKTILEYID
jgi:hypothetical protein